MPWLLPTYGWLLDLRGTEMKKFLLTLQSRLGTPLRKNPVKAFCSNGDRKYLVVPRIVASSPHLGPDDSGGVGFIVGDDGDDGEDGDDGGDEVQDGVEVEEADEG